MQFQKLLNKGVFIDTVAVRDADGNPIPGQTEKRVRVLLLPIRPDAVHLNLTKADEDIINFFQATVDMPVLVPVRFGVVAESGLLYYSLEKGAEFDDFNVLKPKAVEVNSNTVAKAAALAPDAQASQGAAEAPAPAEPAPAPGEAQASDTQTQGVATVSGPSKSRLFGNGK